jgi:chemotaxis protein methyltransferase CheR
VPGRGEKDMVDISDSEFEQFQRFFYETAGISMPAGKKPLLRGRLQPRLEHHGLNCYADYFRLLRSGKVPGEAQIVVDLLTTNETYLFREPEHFDLLRARATKVSAQTPGRVFRVWSAASSTGEEVYSIAMVLDDALPAGNWEILGSDISTRVLDQARRGHYPLQRAKSVPPAFLRKYCLRGVGKEEGTLLICRGLREKLRFEHINLNEALPNIGPFDIIFLRNVMIYFDLDAKRKIVSRVLGRLAPEGLLLIGHSESLVGLGLDIVGIQPAVYRKR